MARAGWRVAAIGRDNPLHQVVTNAAGLNCRERPVHQWRARSAQRQKNAVAAQNKPMTIIIHT